MVVHLEGESREFLDVGEVGEVHLNSNLDPRRKSPGYDFPESCYFYSGPRGFCSFYAFSSPPHYFQKEKSRDRFSCSGD